MLYREVGQYKTSYAADMAVFPILQDRIGLAVSLLVAFVVIPLFGNDFLLNAVMIPFLIFALAAIGLNLLTGYCGLLSLGTGAFMGVGAYACLKLTTYFPQMNIIVWIIASGFFSAAVGALFGLPSLRIKGFYLAVATLAAQFFLEWCFIRVPWLYNNASSGAIIVPLRTIAGVPVTGPTATSLTRYLVVLTHRRRDDVGRLEPGARPHRTHLDVVTRHGPCRRIDRHQASSHQAARLRRLVLLLRSGRRYAGVPVDGGAEPDVFNIDQSFLSLFMVIIGGLGALIGSFFGAGLIYMLPIVLREAPAALGLPLFPATVEELQFVIVGGLVIGLLALEPAGLARLWQIGKQKLRVWPFPY